MPKIVGYAKKPASMKKKPKKPKKKKK